jgi:hypothetical protein
VVPVSSNELTDKIDKLIVKTEGEQAGITNCVSVEKVKRTLRTCAPRHTASWFNKLWLMTQQGGGDYLKYSSTSFWKICKIQ